LELLNVVVEDGYVVRRQLLEARQRPQRVEVVVEDRDLHRVTIPLAALAGTGRAASRGAVSLSAFKKCLPRVVGFITGHVGRRRISLASAPFHEASVGVGEASLPVGLR